MAVQIAAIRNFQYQLFRIGYILFDDLRFRLCYERNFFMIQDFVLFQKSNFVSYHSILRLLS